MPVVAWLTGQSRAMLLQGSALLYADLFLVAVNNFCVYNVIFGSIRFCSGCAGIVCGICLGFFLAGFVHGLAKFL